MDSRQKLAAISAAIREGREVPDWAKYSSQRALNNLNFNSGSEFNGVVEKRSLPSETNLNNLNADEPKKRGGVPRLTLYTDETFKKVMSWGVEEWLIQVCIRDYGEYKVKAQINRIYQMPDAYFKPQYGAINQQRGRIFNKEMQKLKASKNSPSRMP